MKENLKHTTKSQFLQYISVIYKYVVAIIAAYFNIFYLCYPISIYILLIIFLSYFYIIYYHPHPPIIMSGLGDLSWQKKGRTKIY